MDHFEYGSKEIEWLKAKDPVLGAVIDEIGHIERPVISDMFIALVNSIVGQQISSKAMVTVWSRMQERHGPITPRKIYETAAEDLQKCGMTMRKAEYIKEIADSVLSGELDLAQLKDMSDDEVCRRLSQLRGIGIWTAEMLMIFSMQRLNIFSKDDLAILRGLRMVYRHRKITPALFAKYKRRYSPYATIASLYLWSVAGGACPSLTDPAVGRGKSKVRKK
jgi:3-methyladenine DNA glycosylase/8-oxoguanine DNA glycosylase